MSAIDNTMKAKLNNYNLVKGSLLQMQRKKTWVIYTSVRSCIGDLIGMNQRESFCQVVDRRRIEERFYSGFRVPRDTAGGRCKVHISIVKMLSAHGYVSKGAK